MSTEGYDINLSVIAELVEQLEQDLLILEELLDSPNDATDLIHRIFRTAHNLKSSFGMIHRESSSSLVHAIESNFDLIRNGFAKPTAYLLHQALLAVDAMRFNIFLPEERTDDLHHLQRELEAIFHEASQSRQKGAVTSFPLTERQKKLVRGMVNEQFRLFQIDKVISPRGMSEQAYHNLPIYDDIREVGIHIATVPEFSDLSQTDAEVVMKILLATTFDEQELGLHIFDSFRPIDPDKLFESHAKLQEPVLDESTGKASQHLPKAEQTIQASKLLSILIAEDDFVSRTVIHEILLPFGTCDLAADGREALLAFEQSIQQGVRYDLVCLDIMMPVMDGTQALEKIREIEVRNGIIGNDRAKIVMTTALDSMDQVFKDFRLQCDAYLIKPITKSKVLNQLRKLHMIEQQ